MSLLDEFSIPNLDGEEDSVELWRASRALGRLSRLCGYKAHAVQARKRGQIDAALLLERAADRLLSALPDSWKW